MTLTAGMQLRTAVGVSTVHPTLDFETYSAAGFVVDPVTKRVSSLMRNKSGLAAVGTPVYAEHPSTEVLCLAYDLRDGGGVRLWVPGGPDPTDLIEHVRAGRPVEAHNFTFEFWIWNMIMCRRYGWPPLTIQQGHCSMAKARRWSIPGALGKAAAYLGTTGKDPDGDRLLRMLSRPHTPTKKRADIRWTPSTAWGEFLKLYRYCQQDVTAEAELSAIVPDLTPFERKIWEVDQTINARGVAVDTVTLDAALDLLGQAERKYTTRAVDLTGGAVGSLSERDKILAWLATQGVHLPDLTSDTVEGWIKSDALPGSPARELLTIRSDLGSANVKKLRTIKAQLSSDGRLRNQYVVFGADRTGRFSSGGAQLQNITARGPESRQCEDGETCGKIYGAATGHTCPRCGSEMTHGLHDWTIKAVRQAVEDIRTCDLDHVERVWGPIVEVLTGCLRGLFIASPGKKLVCVDFSAIEAVILACLARCEWRIEVFRTHGKIYEMSASKITGTPLEEYLEYKRQNGTHHVDRKKIGKVAELASGYSGWIGAWRAFGCELSDQEAKEAILAWRAASPEVVDFWGGQYRWCGPGRWDFKHEFHGLEGCAILAVLNPGKTYSHHEISYCVLDDVLHCRLPSGRFLYYHRPRVDPCEDKLNRGPAYSLSFEGYNTNAAKGPVGWYRQETWGGKLTENVVQATGLDIQALALINAEGAGWPVVMHTHDELTCEVPDTPDWSVEKLTEIMTDRPAWAGWWPIKGDGWEDDRYQKD